MPHSEICGSKGARPSPQLIAACYVLHRLCVPRHPPDALALTLDRSATTFHAQKESQCTNDFVHRSKSREWYLRSVLVSYGSTGCATRLTPPSQCQRSCEDARLRGYAVHMSSKLFCFRRACVAVWCRTRPGLPSEARGQQAHASPSGYAGQSSLRYRVAKPGGPGTS